MYEEKEVEKHLDLKLETVGGTRERDGLVLGRKWWGRG